MPHNERPTVNKRISQLKKQRKVSGGDAEATPPDNSPANVLRQLKESQRKQVKSKRGKKK